jgi:hypothetical protein
MIVSKEDFKIYHHRNNTTVLVCNSEGVHMSCVKGGHYPLSATYIQSPIKGNDAWHANDYLQIDFDFFVPKKHREVFLSWIQDECIKMNDYRGFMKISKEQMMEKLVSIGVTK